jgi:hypothetical protein
MKFNWGTGAFTLFGGFVIFMLGLVYFASQQSNELVTEDYYEKELEFKEIIKKQARTEKLSEQIQLKIENNVFSIIFPEEVGINISGKVIFFKPSSKNDDKEIPFQINSNNYNINTSDFSSGMYKVKIDWKANGIEYYNEKEIIFP